MNGELYTAIGAVFPPSEQGAANADHMKPLRNDDNDEVGEYGN